MSFIVNTLNSEDRFAVTRTVKDINGNELDFDAVLNLMDWEICNMIESKISEPMTDQEYFEVYSKEHEARYHEHFAPYYGEAW